MTINGQDVTQQFLLVACTSFVLIGTVLFVALVYRLLRASDPQVLMRNKVSLLFAVPAGILTFVLCSFLLIPAQLAPTIAGTESSPSPIAALATSLIAVVAFAIFMTLIATLGTILGLVQATPDITHMRRLSRSFDRVTGLLTRFLRVSRGGPGAA